MWKEKTTAYKFNLVENEGGPTLGYDPESVLRLLRRTDLHLRI